MNKKIFGKIFLAIAFIFGLIACENRDITTIETQNAPIVVDLSTNTLFLDSNFPKNPALTVYWEPTKYSVPTEIFYRLEISSNQAFTNPSVLTTLKESNKNVTFTAEQMNAAAALVKLPVDIQGTIYFRVVSYLGTNNSMMSTSNITSLKITPYKLSYPDFYLVGAACYVGWSAGDAQLLYKKDNMSYIYTYLSTGQGTTDGFRFLGQQGWDPKNYSLNVAGVRDSYHYFNQFSSNIIDDSTNDENMKLDAASGIYKIAINADKAVQSLNVTASPIFDYTAIANLYIAGTVNGNGWDAASAIAMTKTSTGVFEFTAVLKADTAFKFLGQKSWGDIEFGNILKDNAGYSGYIGPKGDNGDIKFVGDGTSQYKIKVNLKAGIYSIVKQ